MTQDTLPGIIGPEYFQRVCDENLIPDRFLIGPEVEVLPRGLYLNLIHGRTDPDQVMESWGTTCPVLIGPISQVHYTYNNAGRLSLDGWDSDIWLDTIIPRELLAQLPANVLVRFDDMLYFNGVFYGDWGFISR